MPRIGARAKGDFGTNRGVVVAGQQCEHSPEGVAYDGNALGVHAVGGLQKRQPGKGVIELPTSHQPVVQLLARLGALSFCLLKKVLREGALIGGKALATTAEIKKNITVLEKNRGQIGGSFGHCPSGRVLGVVGSGPVIEQHRGKRARPEDIAMLSDRLHPWIRLVQLIGWLGMFGTLIVFVHLVWSWRDEQRGLWSKIGDGLIALACLGFAWFVFTWNMLHWTLRF
jgi:hypothetical protein